MVTRFQVPAMLVVFDGFGYSKDFLGNAIQHAHMPMYRSLLAKHGAVLLQASGPAVGLLPGSVGNSEVGHLTLGAGRVVPSMLVKMHQLVAQGLEQNAIFAKTVASIQPEQSIHLIGLLSSGGVHSSLELLYAAINYCAQRNIRNIFVHAILDGRDVLPSSAAEELKRLEEHLRKVECGRIASVQGRFFAMDRDHNWDRTVASYTMMTEVQKNSNFASWQEVLTYYYALGITDEFIPPVLLTYDGIMRANDGLLVFNTRPDRIKQLMTCFGGLYKQVGVVPLAWIVTPTEFIKSYTVPVYVLEKEQSIPNTLLDVLAAHQVPVVLAAESEKEAHVTYFFKGMRQQQYCTEERLIIPSIKQKNYAKQPEMQAEAITHALLRAVRRNPTAFFLVNYANADMVGHSGDFAATIKACEVLDQQLAALYAEVVVARKGIIWLLSDHGNAEEKISNKEMPITAHSKNPVLLVTITQNYKASTACAMDALALPVRGLSAVAPTILAMLNIPIPQEMEVSLNKF